MHIFIIILLLIRLYEMKDPGQPVRSNQYDKEPGPLLEEVEWALKQMPNGKSPGIDGIPIEIWKATGNIGIQMWKLCVKIWTS